MGHLIEFCALTYGLTWICFISVAALPIPQPYRSLLVLLGAFAPSLIGLLLTARHEGNSGVRTLLGHVLQWRVPARWYVFAVAYMAAVKVAVALAHRALWGAWPRFGTDPLYVIPFAIIFSTPFQAGEEIGWRGYVLPRLEARFGLAGASLLLGLIWAFWHLPQFFIREADTYGQSFLAFVLQVTALSVTIAWLWACTGRSLLLPMLLHASVNNSKDIVPSAVPNATNPFGLHVSLVGWLTIAGLWIGAGYFLRWMSKSTPQCANESQRVRHI